MQNNLYNLSNPQSPLKEHSPKKVLTWVLIVLVIIGAGFLVYKKFIGNEPSAEEKLEVMNNLLNSQDDGIAREEKQKFLDDTVPPNDPANDPNQEDLKKKNDFLKDNL